MDWFNQFILDFYIFNTVFIGLTTVAALLTKRYGVFSVQTILSLLSLYTGFLLFMASNPYYDNEYFNTLFMIAPVIIVRIYYDIRLTYTFILFVVSASQIHHFLHKGSSIDFSLGLLYLFLSALIILIPTLKNKTLHTFILVSVSYLSTIFSIYMLHAGSVEASGAELVLWGLNVLSLTAIGSLIVPELMEFIEMNFNKKDLEMDALTGVYNRLSFNQHMDTLFLKERNGKLENFSILFFDMNKYKSVNDSYGHHVGDHVLVNFAKSLENEMGVQDRIFRYGGDEFIVYTPKTGNELIELLIKLDRNIQGCVQLIDGHSIKINYSVGVAEYPYDTVNVREMVKLADAKMYKDKQASSALM